MKQSHLHFVSSSLSINEMFNALLREELTFKLAINELIINNDLQESLFVSSNLQIRLAIEFLLNYYRIVVISYDKPEFEMSRFSPIKFHPILKLLLPLNLSSK